MHPRKGLRKPWVCSAVPRIGNESVLNMRTHNLAVYGTLGPGGPNHHVLADIPGRWMKDVVNGHLSQDGWGAAQGFLGITLDPNGPEVPVDVLIAADMGPHWDMLDAFEGDGYRRVPVTVDTADGPILAAIYEVITG